MANQSAIEWTDATWNPVTGCSKVSPGCAHCYAETVALRFWPTQYRPVLTDSGKSIDSISTSHHEDYLANGFARPREFTDVMCHEDRLDQPLRWRKPRRVFVNSMSDLFHESVPDQFIVDIFGIMALAHWHTFQILTKRPDRMRAFLAAGDHGIVRQFMLLQQNGGTSTRPVFRALDIKRRDNIEWRWPLPNVWLGVSVENQHFADERIPLLLNTPAAVRFVSAEPLLGDVSLLRYLRAPGPPNAPASRRNYLDWVIVGGESGRDARPFNLAWARALIFQCKLASVPCFMKQLGKMPYEGTADPFTSGPEARNCHLYELDIDKGHGGDPVKR